MKKIFIKSKMHKARSALTSAFVLILASSCALNEGPPPEKKKNLQSNLGCLSEIQNKLVDYVDGKLKSPSEIDGMVECAATALTTFKERTHGQRKNKFTAGEIRNFLQHYFLDEFTITDQLLLEAMRVKQAIIGGEDEEFSIADIDYGIGIIRRIGEILKGLQVHMPMGVKRFEKMKEADLDRVILDIHRAADQFSSIVTEKGISYSFSDMDRFLGELIKHFPDVKSLSKLRENLDLASSFKSVLISPDRSRDQLGSQDWKVILEDGARWAGVMLKYLNLDARSSDFMRGKSRDRLSQIVDEALGLTSRIVTRHKGVIRFEVLNELIDDLPWKGKVGRYTLRKSTLKKTLKAVVLRAFSETDRSANGRAAKGVTISHLKAVDRLIDEILQGTAFIEELYKAKTQNPNFEGSATVPRNAFALLTDAQIQTIAKKTGGGTTLVQVAKSLRSTYSGLPAYYEGDSKEIVFKAGMENRARTYNDAFTGVWLKPLFKRALRGYLEEGDIKKRGLECWERVTPAGQKCVESGLNEKEFKTFITDFWPVMLDFKFVWTTSIIERDSKKRFMEAALFTPLSNGDEYISMDEGLAMVMFMISAKPLGTRLHAAAAEVCKHGPKDESGQPTLEPWCYRQVVLDFSSRSQLAKKLWGTMPLFMKYYDDLSSSEQAELKKLIEEPMRKEGYVPELYFDSACSDTLGMMFHYIESLYSRFDRHPNDMTINRTEAMNAFPIFRKTLAGIADMDENSNLLKDVFTWLLAKGRPPVDPEYKGLKKFFKSIPFLSWSARNPKFEAPRGNLISVFGEIGKMAAAPAAVQPTPAPTREDSDESQ